MYTNNVIAFPKEYRRSSKQPDLETVNKNIDLIKHYHMQETIENIAPIIFNHLDLAGFELGDDDDSLDERNIKQGSLIIESIRAVMYSHYGLVHPFHDLADQLFKIDDVSIPSLRIVDEINLKLKKSEGYLKD